MKNATLSRVHRLVAVGCALALAGLLGPHINPSPAHAADEEFIQPVTGYVSGVIGNRCPRAATHEGIDITGGSINGTPIGAALGGTVTGSGWYGGYGNAVKMSHEGGYETLYAHMIQNPGLTVGSWMGKGSTIGYVGSTGNSTGPHLHLEVWRNGANIGHTLGYSCGQRVTKGDPIRGGGAPASAPAGGNASRTLFDVNSDAKSDLLAIHTDGTLLHYYGDGSAGFRSAMVGGGWSSTTAIVHGDYTGDGDGDIIRQAGDGTMLLYRGNGAGAYTDQYVGSGWAPFTLLSGGADINGDGHADLVARSNGSLHLYAGNGNGGFHSSPIGVGWDSMSALVVGDFDRNGYADILARGVDGTLWSYLRYAGGFAAGTPIGPGWGGFSTLTGGADYTGDGVPDVIARRASDGTLWLYPGNGRGAIDSGYPIGSGWGSMRLIS